MSAAFSSSDRLVGCMHRASSPGSAAKVKTDAVRSDGYAKDSMWLSLSSLHILRPTICAQGHVSRIPHIVRPRPALFIFSVGPCGIHDWWLVPGSRHHAILPAPCVHWLLAWPLPKINKRWSPSVNGLAQFPEHLCCRANPSGVS